MVRILSKWWETSKMDILQFTNNSALSLGEETSPFKMQKEMEKYMTNLWSDAFATHSFIVIYVLNNGCPPTALNSCFINKLCRITSIGQSIGPSTVHARSLVFHIDSQAEEVASIIISSFPSPPLLSLITYLRQKDIVLINA